LEAVRIRTDEAVIGMVVAADIYSSNDQLIITKGAMLDEKIIAKLRYYGIYGFYVYKGDPKKEVHKEESYLDMVRSTPEFKKFNRTYVESMDKVEDSFHSIVSGEYANDLNKLIEETDKILMQGRNGIHILEMLHGIRDYDDITYVHSINVSLICNIFAGWLKMSKEETKVLTLAGLFHDIGKMLTDVDIVKKPGRLTKDEYKEMKLHSVKGYQVLKDMNLDIRIKYATLMHHERCDGSGYPNGFRADQIERMSKIVAIADVYDAMTSNRTYRGPICPFEVVSNFERDGFLKFDPGYLMIFLERIVESYLHNLVRLNDGREGEVVMINKLSLSRPVIRCGDEFVDLSKEPKLSIESVL